MTNMKAMMGKAMVMLVAVAEKLFSSSTLIPPSNYYNFFRQRVAKIMDWIMDSHIYM